MEQKEYFAYNAISNLKNILKREKAKNIFLVTGKISFELSGAREKLAEQELNYHRFSAFSPNPKIEDIENGFHEFKQGNYDSIVAIGGGSSIDVAKTIKLFHFHNTKSLVPLIAIPTTAGSGSEATYFIVYYIGKEKQSEGNPKVTLPNYSICDPQLTFSLPKETTASTGLDAFAQAVESYWCINSIQDSKKLAEKSINLTLKNLEKAVHNPDRDSRENMMKAADLAGKAINITKTTASHSIAYPITSYFNIPHGHAAALTLAEMLEYSSEVTDEDCSDKRGASYVKETIDDLLKILGVSNVRQGKKLITSLIISTGLKTRLSELNLTREDLDLIVEKGFHPARVKNNPRVLTSEELKNILFKIF